MASEKAPPIPGQRSPDSPKEKELNGVAKSNAFKFLLLEYFITATGKETKIRISFVPDTLRPISITEEKSNISQNSESGNMVTIRLVGSEA